MTWKQPRCPSADEWIRKPWYIYTMEYYSVIKKNTFESVLMRWMKLELIIQSPKDYSIHLCLFCCLAWKVIVTIFLNSIYMRYYTVLMFFFLAYFTLYNRLQFHPSHQNWFKWILFNDWVILHCVYVPQLSYPFICWWTSRLFPCPGEGVEKREPSYTVGGNAN